MRKILAAWAITLLTVACGDDASSTAGAGGAGGGAATTTTAGEGGCGACPAPECSRAQEDACVAVTQACVGEGDCVDPDSLGACPEAASLPGREPGGPILVERSFLTRDDVSDPQCDIGQQNGYVPAGSTIAYVLRLAFRDVEGDGLTSPLTNDELKAQVQVGSNVVDVADRLYASGLEAGGAEGFFNVTLCFDQEYPPGELVVAATIPDAMGNGSNPLCVTYEGGMNGSMP